MIYNDKKTEAGIHFRNGTEDAGFSSSTTSHSSNADATTIVRELIQNSLDAAKEIHRAKTVIRFTLERISQQDLPYISDIQKAFPAALKAQRKLSNGELPDIQEQIVSVFKEALKEHSSYILSISDNGVGLDKVRMKALLGDGRSAKASSGGGAHGYGHLTVLPSSNLRLVYYGGVTSKEGKISSGHCVLAPFVDEDGTNHTKDGYLVESLNDDMFDQYTFLRSDQIPGLISEKLDEIHHDFGSGTVVIISSFNFFKGKIEDLWKSIKKAAATNFFASFAQDELVVEFNDSEARHLINSENIEEVLEEFSGDNISRSFISGSKALECYETISSGENIEFETDIGNVSGKLRRFERGRTSRIDLCRNGMWIVYNNSPGKRLPRLQNTAFGDFQPFHLVLLLEAKNGDLHKLVRKAEPPVHDRVDLKQLLDKDRKKLENAFSQIQQQIKARLNTITGESVIMEGILSLPIGGTGSGGEHGEYAGEWQPFERRPRSSSGEIQIEEGIEGSRGKKKGKRKQSGSGAGTKTSKRKGNATPFRAISVPLGPRKYEVEIHPLDDIDSGEIRFMIDQNMDETCRFMNAEPLVQMKNIKFEREALPDSHINKNAQGQIVGIRVNNIEAGKQFRLEFDFLLPDNLAISDGRFVALKAELIKRKKTERESIND